MPFRHVLAHLTLRDVPPPELVRIAARAGFDGVTVDISTRSSGVPAPQFAMTGGSELLRETRRALDETGLFVLDVQAVRLGALLDLDGLGPFCDAAVELGARHVVVVSDEPDEAAMAGQLAQLAERLAPCGVKPLLEFMRYGCVRDIGAARRIVEAAGAANLGLMVDTLHLSRSGGTAADMQAAGPQLMPYIQLCDAPASPPATREGLREEALFARLFPGEGDLALEDMLAVLPEGACLSVEVAVERSYPQIGPEDVALRALNQSRALAATVAGRGAASLTPGA